jgi:xanthine/uracil/vitamin C permease (AzgA family)
MADRHPGIRIDKIPVKGALGLVFTLGIVVMTLISLPQARWFFVLALPVGILVGVGLYLSHRR